MKPLEKVIAEITKDIQRHQKAARDATPKHEIKDTTLTTEIKRLREELQAKVSPGKGEES